MVKFIAELCSNHNNDFERAVKLIECAKSIGCDAVKFQLFRIDKLFHPSLLNHPDYAFVHERKRWELPLTWLPELKEICEHNQIQFGCTPFYIEAINFLAPYVDFYKLSSYDINRIDMIKAIAKTKSPLIMSTGMATWDEISLSVSEYTQARGFMDYDLTLLHCISTYPTPLNEAYLSQLGKLNLLSNQKLRVGLSDHSTNPAVIYRAVHKYGASAIEFHLDLADGLGWENKQGHCWQPERMREVIKNVRDGIEADSTGKNYDVMKMKERGFRASDEDGLRPEKGIREKLNVSQTSN